MTRIWKTGILFGLGGCGYLGLELLWRGRSHVSMFLAGGLCFLLIGGLNRAEPRLPYPLRLLAGAAIITMVELAAGMAVNRNYGVWDYREQWGNFCGQICPAFSLLWIPVTALALLIFEFLEPRLEQLAEKRLPGNAGN